MSVSERLRGLIPPVSLRAARTERFLGDGDLDLDLGRRLKSSFALF